MTAYFGTPKSNKHILIYNTLQAYPEKVRKTAKNKYIFSAFKVADCILIYFTWYTINTFPCLI